MKRVAAYAAALLVVVGGGVAVFWPLNFWRLFDANLRPLALTEAENYCTGFHGFQVGWAEHDKAVDECEREGTFDNATPSVANSVEWVCRGIVAGGWVGGTVSDCENIFERDQLWAIKGGGITWEWSDAWPRPVSIGGTLIPPSDSRTGERDGFSRGDTTSSTTTTTGEE